MTPLRDAAPPLAEELVHRLFVLIKAAAVYGPKNDGYRSHSVEARASLEQALAAGNPVRLEAFEERLYFNDAPIRLSPADAAANFMIGEMSRLGIESIEFGARGGVPQLDAFVSAFHKAVSVRDAGFAELQRLLKAGGIDAISVIPVLPREEPAPGAETGAAGAREAFNQAVVIVEDLMTRVRDGREVDFNRAKGVVRDLAEQVIADAQALFELSILQRFDQYTYAHCVNVSVYSVAIGAQLGLQREQLVELGFGGLFHDVGKAKLPRELIDKPDEFDEKDWRLMRLHPALGVKALLTMRRPFDATLARAVSIAFEHHLGIDGQGYPKLPNPRRQDLYSRICAVADAFDAMTSGRVYTKRAMAPDEALHRMVQRAGTAFDPLILRLFIKASGVFPIGTALLLDTGEMGIVRRNNPGDRLRPEVVVFTDRHGRRARPELVDLARADFETGEPLRSVRKTLDPRKEGIDAREVLSSLSPR